MKIRTSWNLQLLLVSASSISANQSRFARRDGWSPLHMCAKKNHTQFAELLLAHNISVDLKKKYVRFYS